MSAGYRISNPEGIYFITFAVVEWVDVFTRRVYMDILIDSLKYCQREKGLVLYAWCFMSNHVHMICSAREGHNLSDILRDFKKYTSKRIVKEIQNNSQESRKGWMLWIFKNAGSKNSKNKDYQFWRQKTHPIELESNFFKDQKLEYIHNNPVVAGIVREAQDYQYSSAIDYSGGKGLIDVEYL
ncbi:REP-associated tyrosine transposase [Fulvivirga ligni]|uniref:REP-associated tyrosine transposase n=1 Tax=Fulvivirga ligni TaxID=2904246 RepID=UPI001F3808A5|nr:transposase [Fulvivirga ligni]UII20319.1 transposase [Fulvivirga ligni]